MARRYRIGIDVGGTFTDFLLMGETGTGRIFKVLSTPDDPSEAVFRGMAEMAAADGLDTAAFLAAVDRIVLGTTVTTNAVLTRRWVKTGLLATAGFRDALAMRRGVREKLYDNKYLAPEPIVPRTLRLPVRGRIDHAGTEVAPLEPGDVDRAVEAFQAAGVEAVAICFMHSYANPAHERVAAARVRELMPAAYVSASSEIVPQLRFYERTSTTVLNAAVGPLLKRYLARLEGRLAAGGFRGILLIMQSNGGVTTPAVAAERAATTVLSGPAAGPIAGQALIGSAAGDGFITIDMGGTSFEASLAQGGRPAITTSATVDRFALALPTMDIKTIGAGGGSMAWIDQGGLLRMGPQSAGAKPGPVCYGLGGTVPTTTDANLVLGYLSADFFAGGRMALDAEAARRAIDVQVAKPLGLGLVQAAAGMYRVMNVNMASAIREVSIERGFDPREMPLICAGGAAGTHAAMIAAELGIRRVLVPREASVFCASGMLRTDLRHDYVRSYAAPFTPQTLDRTRLLDLLRDMEAEGNRTLEQEGVPPDRRRFVYALDLRYVGQYHEVRVEEIPETELKRLDLAAVRSMFHRLHDRLYGYSLEEDGTVVELVNLRMTAFGITDKPDTAPLDIAGPDAGHALKTARRAYAAEQGDYIDMPVYDGDALRPGNRFHGPALVESAVTTVYVPQGFGLEVDAFGTIILSAGAGR
ncbi:MAG: hydantoinase/oxoprolinase family protein [Rhodospirillaceae bacterium]|nr:hydantoinase/oxoprolinase family protein [Rhodospirillaceae bacterium]